MPSLVTGVVVVLASSIPAEAADHPEAVIVTHDWNTGIGLPRSVAAGDLDGDGTADLVTMSSGRRGAVAIVGGPTYGRTDIHRFPKVAGWCCYLGTTNGLGDHDPDGATDLLTSSRLGSTYLFLGPITADTTGPGAADAVLVGPRNEVTGADVDVAGDLDGDGAPDIVIGAPYAGDSYDGRVWVASGPVSGRRSLETATYVFDGEDFNQLGTGTSSVGDLTGDGIGDLALAAAGNAGEFGAVYLVEGGAAPGAYAPEDVAWAILRSADEGSGLDEHDVVARDYDGDGAVDLLMADDVDPGFGGFVSGAAYAVLGPFAGEESLTDADTVWSTEEAVGYLGESFAAGDFDGDAQLDVVIGTSFIDDYDGVVYVQLGQATGSVDVADLPTLRTPGRDALGTTLVTIPDWTGDGGDEIAIGAMHAGGNYYGGILVFESDSMFD